MISYAKQARPPTVPVARPVSRGRVCRGGPGRPATDFYATGVHVSMLAQGDDLERRADEVRLRWWRSSRLGLRGEGTQRRRAWQASYVRRIFVIDALIGVVAATVGYVGRFGADTLPAG